MCCISLSDVIYSRCYYFRKAESLKKELSPRRNGLNAEGDGVSSRAQLQDLYKQLLITNLEYALDKKIEQEL